MVNVVVHYIQKCPIFFRMPSVKGANFKGNSREKSRKNLHKLTKWHDVARKRDNFREMRSSQRLAVLTRSLARMNIWSAMQVTRLSVL